MNLAIRAAHNYANYPSTAESEAALASASSQPTQPSRPWTEDEIRADLNQWPARELAAGNSQGYVQGIADRILSTWQWASDEPQLVNGTTQLENHVLPGVRLLPATPHKHGSSTSSPAAGAATWATIRAIAWAKATQRPAVRQQPATHPSKTG